MKIKYKVLLISYALVFTCISPLIGQTTRKAMYDDFNKMGGIYYAYPHINQNLTPAPKNYTPFYISHYGRHGSRYLLGDHDSASLIELLTKAKKENAITPLGIDVISRLKQANDEIKGKGSDLTPLGVRQQRGVAERMYKNFPSVFKDSMKISARSTTKMRCAMSMDAFSERLKELNPTLQITRQPYQKYMYYMSSSTKAMQKFNSKEGPWRKDFYEKKDSLTRPDRLVHSLFSDQNFIDKMVNGFDMMWKFYWVTVDMQNMESKVRFYDLFKADELFDLWQSFNYEMYMNNGNSPLSNKEALRSAVPLLNNIITTADQVISKNQNTITLRFGHDGNLMSLLALMKINNANVSIGNIDSLYKYWTDYKLTPMCGNLQIIFYKKKKTNSDILIKILLNENEVNLPFCNSYPLKNNNSPYYKWKDVKEYYLNRIQSLVYTQN